MPNIYILSGYITAIWIISSIKENSDIFFVKDDEFIETICYPLFYEWYANNCFIQDYVKIDEKPKKCWVTKDCKIEFEEPYKLHDSVNIFLIYCIIGIFLEFRK